MRVFDPEEATAFFLPFFSADLYSMGNHTVQAKVSERVLRPLLFCVPPLPLPHFFDFFSLSADYCL